MSELKYPRLMIAGAHSSAGKTTIALGLMKALSRQGSQVQPFKVGPDYIDPGLHFHAAGRKSHNLDSWMSDRPVLETVFAKNARQADMAIIEGVMGLYDGARGERIKGSSAEIAVLLKVPVILVVDVQGMAQSCIATAKGFMDYCPDVQIQGVILNKATKYHEQWIKPALEAELGIKVIGCLPQDQHMAMPERHLGLLPADESHDLDIRIESMADCVEKYLDLNLVRQIAELAPELTITPQVENPQYNVKIGVAYDRAFNFYYQDSLDYLQELGAELVFFSPLDDDELPRLGGLYIGGGFPEMFLDRLTANEMMKIYLWDAYHSRMPIFAECGGFMYLCREITDFEGQSWNTIGLISARIKMTRQLQALGYIKATALSDSIIGHQGDVFRGHEFHYSIVENINPAQHAFSLEGGIRNEARLDGFSEGNLFASYVHLHLRSNKSAAENFLQACTKYRDWWHRVNRCLVNKF